MPLVELSKYRFDHVAVQHAFQILRQRVRAGRQAFFRRFGRPLDRRLIVCQARCDVRHQDATRDRATTQQQAAEKRDSWQNNANKSRDRQKSSKPKTSWSDYNRSQQSSRMSQLNRDYHARQMGNYQFKQKRNLSRNRMSSGRMSSGRMRSGGFRR